MKLDRMNELSVYTSQTLMVENQKINEKHKIKKEKRSENHGGTLLAIWLMWKR